MKRRRAEAMGARHVKEGGTFGGKRKTVRAEDGGEVRRRLNARQGGRVLYQKVGGTDARGANVEGVCERGAGGRGQ